MFNGDLDPNIFIYIAVVAAIVVIMQQIKANKKTNALQNESLEKLNKRSEKPVVLNNANERILVYGIMLFMASMMVFLPDSTPYQWIKCFGIIMLGAGISLMLSIPTRNVVRFYKRDFLFMGHVFRYKDVQKVAVVKNRFQNGKVIMADGSEIIMWKGALEALKKRVTGFYNKQDVDRISQPEKKGGGTD